MADFRPRTGRQISRADRDDVPGSSPVAQAAGKRFQRGVSLYRGEDWVPFGAGMDALPVSALWHLGAEKAPTA
jgi:hypothetical protein